MNDSLSIFQVDAFADRLFEGNPAAVVPLTHWLEDDLMQRIAAENNLSETAFFAPSGNGFHIRWFTPLTEVRLCGHATLATAHVLFNELNHTGDCITFESLSGPLIVRRKYRQLEMDFPSQPPSECPAPPLLAEALGATPISVLSADDYIAVFASHREIADLKPNFSLLAELDLRGLIVTAPGSDVDFVARFFAPAFGIDEDPVTGSAYTQLAPYWGERLEKTRLNAHQLSARGGSLSCEVKGDRVMLSGRAKTFLRGRIETN